MKSGISHKNTLIKFCAAKLVRSTFFAEPETNLRNAEAIFTLFSWDGLIKNGALSDVSTPFDDGINP